MNSNEDYWTNCILSPDDRNSTVLMTNPDDYKDQILKSLDHAESFDATGL